MPEEIKDTHRPLIRKIRQLRHDAGLLQKEVAEEIGVSRQTYQQYESGKEWIPEERIRSLAELYNVSIEYLLND
uniref:XRE family transcriptional regulator n=1 Tax=uncultured bacterium Contig643 TaxID=1393602 RepID=W0FKQ2_9BACT|nr:XRE family transcriptional regulator [uncultured bacterium Contig643]